MACLSAYKIHYLKDGGASKCTRTILANEAEPRKEREVLEADKGVRVISDSLSEQRSSKLHGAESSIQMGGARRICLRYTSRCN